MFPGHLPLCDVVGVVALVALDAGRGEVPNLVDDAVEEVAVVTDDEECTLPALQGGF